MTRFRPQHRRENVTSAVEKIKTGHNRGIGEEGALERKIDALSTFSKCPYN